MLKRLLLDTHVLVWWLRDAGELGEQAKKLIAARQNRVYVSAVSLWDIQIKHNIGKITAPEEMLEIVEEEGFEILNITGRHAEQIGNLPDHHRDPFDRMLIAQAQVEGLMILTSDKQINMYGVGTIRA